MKLSALSTHKIADHISKPKKTKSVGGPGVYNIEDTLRERAQRQFSIKAAQTLRYRY